MHLYTNLVKTTLENNRSLSSYFSSLNQHDHMLTLSRFCCRGNCAAKDCEFSQKKKKKRKKRKKTNKEQSDRLFSACLSYLTLVFRFLQEQKHPAIGPLSPGGEVYGNRSQQGH